jgi:hypothetical protein
VEKLNKSKQQKSSVKKIDQVFEFLGRYNDPVYAIYTKESIPQETNQ